LSAENEKLKDEIISKNKKIISLQEELHKNIVNNEPQMEDSTLIGYC